jgi:hypothetical protein
MISGDDDEEPTYYEIISKDRKKKKKLDAPSTKNRPNLNIHSNDEIKFNWKITDSVMNGKFGSAVIDCCVEKIDNFEKWKMNSEKLIEFLNKNGKSPSQYSKNQDEKNLFSWTKRQKNNYNPKGPEYSKFIMNNPEIWQIWTDIILDEKYSKFFSKNFENYFENWKCMIYKVLFFIDKNGRNPSQHSKDPSENKLGQFIKTHKKYYDPKGAEYSKFIMNNPEIWQIWTDIILDEKYSKFFSKSSRLPRKRKISTEVQKFQSKLKFPKKDSIMSEEDKSEGSQSESEDSFQSSSLPQKRRFQ